MVEELIASLAEEACLLMVVLDDTMGEYPGEGEERDCQSGGRGERNELANQ